MMKELLYWILMPEDQVKSDPIVDAPENEAGSIPPKKTPQRKRTNSVSEKRSPSPEKTKTENINLEMNEEVDFDVDYDLPKEADNDDS